MNLRLTRTHWLENGIFGVLETEDGEFVADTLEHSYLIPAAGELDIDRYVAKLSVGPYKCRRYSSPHFGYDVFQLEGVPDFQGKPVTAIEIHPGNKEEDSEGCILLGRAVWGDNRLPVRLADSRKTFNEFMAKQDGLEEFLLMVV